MINSVLSQLNVDSVETLVRLARDLGVSIYLCPIETGLSAGFDAQRSKQHLGLDPVQLEDFALRAISLKRRGSEVNDSITYLRTFVGGKKHYTCHAQKVAVTLDANGDVRNCVSQTPFGNVRRTGLGTILKSDSVRKARKESQRCHVCNNPDVIDCSYIWQFRPESAVNFIRLFFR
jgi:MoaA/NifB/PqqE/SkfB family radical SAM enzyme